MDKGRAQQDGRRNRKQNLLRCAAADWNKSHVSLDNYYKLRSYRCYITLLIMLSVLLIRMGNMIMDLCDELCSSGRQAATPVLRCKKNPTKTHQTTATTTTNSKKKNKQKKQATTTKPTHHTGHYAQNFQTFFSYLPCL